jgi:ADP-ribose pyrophosphatase YjhB (NUDIX family)
MVRRGRDPGRGTWSLPGGRVEAGETDADAVVRELREETGLWVRVGHLVGSVRRPAPNGIYVINDYACQPHGGQLRPGDDADDAAWIDVETFATLERTNALSEGLADALREWHCLPQ